MRKLILFFCILLVLGGCKENDNMLKYDKESSYVYFAYANPNRKSLERYGDSITYSFALDTNTQIKEKIIAVPIQIGGPASPGERSYALEIADSSRFDQQSVKFSKTVIAGGKYVDTLYISLQRTAKMRSESTILYLRLKQNGDFIPGNVYNQKLTVIVNDILNEPLWWNRWRTYLGTYHREVLQQWMRIYHFGADPSPDLATGSPGPVYYWNNMPPSAFASWYPVVFKYIEVLKQYFEDHEVYPGGDSSQDRILIP